MDKILNTDSVKNSIYLIFNIMVIMLNINKILYFFLELKIIFIKYDKN